MKQTRRRFTVSASLTASAVCLESLGLAADSADAEIATPLQAGLRSWMDTLLPKDDHSPSAGELGVHLQILARAAGIPEYHELLQKGVQWMDAQAVALGRPSFSKLEEKDRIKVVTEAEAVAPKTTPGLFFYHTHRDGMAFYYGHQESWAGPGYPHPPQPIGFPDYTQPPS